MKRSIFAVISCMTILSLAACSGNNTSDALDTSSSAVTDGSSNNSASISGIGNGSEQSSVSNEIQTPSFTEEPINSGEKSEITEIRITIGETVVTAELNDSETSRDFIALLPLTLNMTRFYDREYAGSLSPAELSQNGEAIDDFENGDVTYYVAGNALAIFFDKANESDQGGLIRMGKITSDLSGIVNMSGNAEVTITLSEVESNMNSPSQNPGFRQESGVKNFLKTRFYQARQENLRKNSKRKPPLSRSHLCIAYFFRFMAANLSLTHLPTWAKPR